MDSEWDPKNLPDGTMEGRGYDTLRRAVESGKDYDSIVRGTVFDIMEYLEDLVRTGDTGELPSADLNALRAWVLGILDAEFAAHLARQQDTGEERDSDRLTRAFRALDVAGIIAREHFDRNPREANYRLSGYVARSADARGFACYTAEDGEQAAGSGALLIGYGAREETPEANAAIGAEVAEVLRAHGLTVNWNGDPRKRLDVAADTALVRRGRRAAFVGKSAAEAPKAEWSARTTGSGARLRAPRWGRACPNPASAGQLSGLLLPWLPEGIAVTLRIGQDRELSAVREWDVLVLTVADGTEARITRFQAASALTAWIAGGQLPTGGPVEPESDLLEVAYQDVGEEGIGSVDSLEPMGLAECRELLYQITPEDGSFLTCVGRSGATIQMSWREGPRLWVERPGPEARQFLGRYATLAEMEELITVLAEEDRANIERLGDLEVISWGG